MLEITPTIFLEESELQEEFVRAAGPGGQNVNKVATAVQLRFDAAHSAALTDEVRTRLLRLAGSRATTEGVVLILARQYRTQAENRAAARAQLAELIRRATIKPKTRRATKPTYAARQQRLAGKKQRAATKQGRRASFDE